MCPACKDGNLDLIEEFSGWKKWRLRKSLISNLEPDHDGPENRDNGGNILSAHDDKDLRDEEYIDTVYYVECESCGKNFNLNLHITDTGYEVEVLEPFKPEDESEMIKRTLM